VITSGYVQALSLLARVIGGPIAMEDPGLPFHREVVRHAGAEVHAIAVDEHGARTDLLDTLGPVRSVASGSCSSPSPRSRLTPACCRWLPTN
jgi:DNA-binding transcriptional MocR family regulator